MRGLPTFVLAAALLAPAPRPAWADPPPVPSPAPPAPGSPAPPTPGGAAYEEHLANGKKLLEDESWAAAQAELEAAYAAAPRAAPLVLIATCQQAEQRWAQAIATLERALRDHGATLDETERKAAEQALSEMRAQVGKVQVVIAPREATLRIDGEDQPPGGPERVIVLGPGPHRLEGRLAGWTPAAQTITVAGGDELAIKLGLVPRPAGAPPDEDDADAPHRVRGPYATLGFTPFVPLPPTDFKGTALGFSGGVQLGYRFAPVAAGELLFEYAHAAASGQATPSFADTPAVPMSYGLTSVRAGLALRLMTTGQRVRFVQVLGGGVMVDTITWTPGAAAGSVTRQGGKGADGFGLSETGLEVDVAHVLLGLTVQQLLGSRGGLAHATHDDFSADTFAGPQYAIGLGLRAGYRLW